MGDLKNFIRLAKDVQDLSFLPRGDPGYKNLHILNSPSLYGSYKTSNQTNTCTDKAARFYYNKLHPGLFLNDLEPLDSHSFDYQEYDKNDMNIYYHVNFKAKKGSRANLPSTFFAELYGEGGPEKVNLCVELDSPGELENCAFCTGIWHPPNNFVGFMPRLSPLKKRRTQAFLVTVGGKNDERRPAGSRAAVAGAPQICTPSRRSQALTPPRLRAT